MVDTGDIAITGVAVILSAAVILTIGGVTLPGTETLENIFLDGSPEVTPEDTFTVKHSIEVHDTVTVNEVIQNFEYETFKEDKNIFSFSGFRGLSLVNPVYDAEVEYRMRNSDNRIVATDSDYIGDVQDFETVTFETGGLPSGEYTIEYIVSFQQKDLFGSEEDTRTEVKTVTVPKPVGGN